MFASKKKKDTQFVKNKIKKIRNRKFVESPCGEQRDGPQEFLLPTPSSPLIFHFPYSFCLAINNVCQYSAVDNLHLIKYTIQYNHLPLYSYYIAGYAQIINILCIRLLLYYKRGGTLHTIINFYIMQMYPYCFFLRK